jgi:ABC-2 type transport system permease protein
MNAIRLYGRYAQLSLRRQLVRRAEAVLTAIGVFVITASEFFVVWALFDRFDQLRGWRLPEVALLYAMVSITWALADAIGRGFDGFASLVRTGEVDRLLLRPRSLVLQILGQELTVRRSGRLIQGLAVLGYVISTGVVAWSAARVALFVAAIAGGVTAFLGVQILQATSAFWTVDGLEVWSAFTYGSVTMSQYPLAIYRGWFRAVFTYVIPIGTVLYFPGVAILDRADPLGAPPIIDWLAPLAGPVFLSGCLAVWRIGVRHYRSTGS